MLGTAQGNTAVGAAANGATGKLKMLDLPGGNAQG